MGLSEYLVTDDLTILLGLTTASVFLLYNLYKPQPLVHPILLGRQSDVARVRMPGESAVHRNYATGLMGRFTIRPSREVLTLLDLIKPESDAPRSLWSAKISNSHLAERVKALGTGLCLAGLTRESNVLLLLNDGLGEQCCRLSISVPALTVPCTRFALYPVLDPFVPFASLPVLESHFPSAIIVQGSLLPHTLELLYELNDFGRHSVVIVAGETDENVLSKASEQVKVVHWADIEAQGKEAPLITSPAPGPDDVFTVSFYRDANNEMQAAHFTHQNITAGVTAIRGLLPPASHSLYEGTSFATLESSKLFQLDLVSSSPIDDVMSTHKLGLPPTTVLFLKPTHLSAVVDAIMANAKKSLLFPLGYFTKESLWDRLVFDNARSAVFGEDAASIRAVVVSEGTVPADLLTPARIALSVPLVIAHTHPLVAAPILASHPQDVQTFAATSAQDFAHVGPPTVNVEVKLAGVDDGAVERGDDPEGVLHVRGPIVGRVLPLIEADEEPKTEAIEEPWVSIGDRHAWTTAKA
ncbi:hypothetical protein BJV77DRAFT_978457 [Russula vinacea]|nr:hypothetical protein BJV77DRAFT_978457 [Russula vinacea]